MARTTEQILIQQLGQMALQIASMQSRNENLVEELNKTKIRIEELSSDQSITTREFSKSLDLVSERTPKSGIIK